MIRLLAVGDIMLGDHPVCIGHGVRSVIKKNGFDFPFKHTAQILKDADITFGNIETVLSDIGLNPAKIEDIELRGSPESAPALCDAGFNVLSIANNHIMQHGKKAFSETIGILKKNGIFCVGLNSVNNISNVYSFEKDKIKIGLVSYSLRPEKYHASKSLYASGALDGITAQVNELSDLFDVVIVSLHWGEEYMNIPSQGQIHFAHEIIDAGASLIIGHHPHVLQGIEKYKRSYIVYSLGNFIFDKWQRNCRETIILDCDIDQNGIKDLNFVPVIINKNYQPQLAMDSTKIRIVNNISKYTQAIYKNSTKDPDSDTQQYTKKSKRAYLVFRLSSYFYFLTHLHRYSFDMIKQSITRSFFRRIKE